MDDRMAVVTGAGSGIGQATALRLVERGLRVCCVGRREPKLKETATLIGERATVVPADISTEDGIATVRAAVGGAAVAALVHAAAVEGIVSLADTNRQTFDRLINANLAGPLFLTQALTTVLDDGAGVVFVGSISALHGRQRHAAYAASKAGLLGLTTSLAVELAPRVRVNCVSPGATNTPMFKQAIVDYLAAYDPSEAERVAAAEQTRLLLRRIAEPDEIATAIVHLALDASYSTGTVLTIDGGYCAR
ncbi:SDR family NAD(P)-dependent oxidoreductase [Amycolatopsis sp. cmx-4-68]|uniref:SDR family NAD(P)-dependent oxidoreductase n=1 Tax=Amycolatopsis sp. cmx-4-68 TaxID=2790938 RepID=UPI00397CE28B